MTLAQRFSLNILFLSSVIIKTIEWFSVPIADIDAFGTLGEIFTQSFMPVRNYFYNTGSIYINGYLAFIFFKLVNIQHGIFFFFLLFYLFSFKALKSLLWHQMISKDVFNAILISVMICPYVFHQRSEIVGLFVCAVFLWLLINGKKGLKSKMIIAINLAIAFFAHPVASITCIYILCLHSYRSNNGVSIGYLINKHFRLGLISVAIFSLVLFKYFSQANVLSYFLSHLSDRFSNPSLQTFIVFILKNGLLAFLIVLIILEMKGVVRWSLIAYLVLLTLFKHDFYFIYTIPVIVYFVVSYKDISFNKALRFKYIGAPIVLSLFFTYLNPTYIKAENREYRHVSSEIYTKLKERQFLDEVHIHIDPSIAAPFIFRDSTTQIIIGSHSDAFFPRAPITRGDLVILKHPHQIRILQENYNILIETLISPVPGLLTARSIYNERQDSLGLYMCRIIK